MVAHIAAVLIGSLIIFAGTDILHFGAEGILVGTVKWFGGILIFLVIAILSLPIGLGLRYLAGHLPILPLFGSLIVGVLSSLMIAYLIHPSLYPSISFETHAVGLLTVHTLAGICGSLTWWSIEFGKVISKEIQSS